MGDYMFMLDSHLSAEQNRALRAVQMAAEQAGQNLFLTGGAMRDLLGGYPTRDLDFSLEGDAVKLAQSLSTNGSVELLVVDEHRRRAELIFPGGITVEIGMAREERYPKPGGKPQVTPATIYEDLRWRDFTVNAIALSLSRASRGLLLDPLNGRADLERRELRTVSNYALYDDPVRLFRLARLQSRLGLTPEERTQRQVENVRESGLVDKISPRQVASELRRLAEEPDPEAVLRQWESAGLLRLVDEQAAVHRLNHAGFVKLQKAQSQIPFGTPLRVFTLPLLLHTLTDEWAPKERAELATRLQLTPEEVTHWTRLAVRAKRVEKELANPALNRPSLVWKALHDVPGEQILYLLMYSGSRLVQDRLRNYVQKYLPTSLEVTDAEVTGRGLTPGTPAFQRRREELVCARLNARPPKPQLEPALAIPASRGRG